MKNKELILDYLEELFPNPKSELNYNKDYELLIAVNIVTKELFSKYPSLEDLAKSDIEDIKKIIKPVGTFNIKAKNVISISQSLLKDYNGKVPNNREYLESLSGVGRKTTNVVLAILYNEPCIAVDTHVSRVSKRLKIANKNDNVLTIEKKLMKKFNKTELLKLHHQLLLFGRYHCKANSPLCDKCKLKDICRKDIK